MTASTTEMGPKRDNCEESELLHPGPQLDLPGPGAARLVQQVHIAFGDRVGVEQAVGLVGGLGAAVAADAAVDYHVRDMDALRGELPPHALLPAPPRELSHCE